jgi:hypothetical protein
LTSQIVGQEQPHRPHVRLLRVRVVMLGIKEFVSGEPAGVASPLDHRGQRRLLATGKFADEALTVSLGISHSAIQLLFFSMVAEDFAARRRLDTTQTTTQKSMTQTT